MSDLAVRRVQALTRVGDWQIVDEEPDQFCRGCEMPTKGRATALLTPQTRIWAPLCFGCFMASSPASAALSESHEVER